VPIQPHKSDPTLPLAPSVAVSDGWEFVLASDIKGSRSSFQEKHPGLRSVVPRLRKPQSLGQPLSWWCPQKMQGLASPPLVERVRSTALSQSPRQSKAWTGHPRESICSQGCHSERGEEPVHSLAANTLTASAEVLRRAKNALLRMTSLFKRHSQLDAGTPPYFCSHFNSSRTLILPCQGFLAKEWPSPGKISSLFGMPSEYSACSSR